MTQPHLPVPSFTALRQTRLRLMGPLGLLLLTATACTPVPELEDRITGDLRATPYPALVPLDQALAQQAPAPQAAEDLETQMRARQARLDARAARLRNRPVD
ncbi:hypothetical protein [Pseudodonghicola flavimaris]|uniref:DUF4398 domain-containing protein n=1 Tax=Pseudodonghicola flavimaris TaxID=3050036 RepID=A0ABT7F4G5_9RHOB|nr:hypothetical protein [Pseudodonghicola flavimaris]MDK3019482.1 hypothetical protein [Pseudodonghicola flavimaris]